MKGKKLYTVMAFIALIALYIMIFFLSSEDADSSSDISMKVTKALLELYYRIKGDGGEPIAAYTVSSAEGFIRKLAHFMEYACVGFLSGSIVIMWFKNVWKGQLFVVIQLFLSAGADELHQYFVPGRNAAVKDVLLDTAGGIAGMLVLLTGVFVWRISGRRKKPG